MSIHLSFVLFSLRLFWDQPYINILSHLPIHFILCVVSWIKILHAKNMCKSSISLYQKWRDGHNESSWNMEKVRHYYWQPNGMLSLCIKHGWTMFHVDLKSFPSKRKLPTTIVIRCMITMCMKWNVKLRLSFLFLCLISPQSCLILSPSNFMSQSV